MLSTLVISITYYLQHKLKNTFATIVPVTHYFRLTLLQSKELDNL